MKNSHVVGIIQARMGSARLPGKTLTNICGKPLLEHIIWRVKHSKDVQTLVVATTINAEDDLIAALCDQLQTFVFRGSPKDVLDRYYQCAKYYKAEIIVRITADNPFADPEVIDQIIKVMLEKNYGYVSNTIPPTYPEGLNVEVFRFEALGRAWRESTERSDREHVTPYIWLHPKLFKIKNVENIKDLSNMRWTLDTPADLAMVRAVYEKLYRPGQIFLMRDIEELLKKHPEIEKLNENEKRFLSHKMIMERYRE